MANPKNCLKMIMLATEDCINLNNLKPFFQVHIMCADPEIVVIYIYGENDDETLMAVCGQSEDEALENYQKYLENFFKD